MTGVNEKVIVYDFVSDFLGIRSGIKISRADILIGLTRYIKNNRTSSSTNFSVDDHLRMFFENCLIIKDSTATIGDIFLLRKKGRNHEKLIVPSEMRFTQLMFYVNYCEKYNPFYILTKKDLKNKKEFFDSFKEDLMLFVFSPDHIDYWIHLGHDVNLKNFSYTKIY